MMKHKTEYDITQLWPIALVILVLGIGLAFSLDIIDDINGDFDANSYADNATEATMSGLAKFGDKMGTIVTIVIAVIIIGLVRLFGAQR